MPVWNDKLGEEDFVDMSLVPKIMLDSGHIVDMESNKKEKIIFRFEGDPDNQAVNLIAESSRFGTLTQVIPLQMFEELLFKTVNHTEDMRLESVEEFISMTAEIMDRYVENGRLNQVYFARTERSYEQINGIGIIRDMKTDQDVGTFENLTYSYNDKRRVAHFGNLILSGRTVEDLEEANRYQLSFYSIDDGVVYSFVASDSSSAQEVHGLLEANGTLIGIDQYEFSTEPFTESHPLRQTVQEAQETKEMLFDIDPSHPLYDVKQEEFRNSRLMILEASKQKLKQEKIVSQFADIDLF